MLRFALRAFLMLSAMVSIAWAGNLTLALSDSGGPYAEFATALSDALQGSNWKITTSGKSAATNPPAGSPDLIITAGGDALRQMLARTPTAPIIATLLPRQNYEKILAESSRGRSRITAIYLDQPPARQAAFLRQLLPGQKRIGMLVSTETRGTAGQFRQVFANAGLALDAEESDTDSTLLPALNALLPRVNALLAMPDSTIYKRDNIKAILITSYRHQRPVIAFSAAFVNAGALAALYSTPTQIARQTADMVAGLGPTLPPPTAPNLFAIAINQNVALALGLTVPDEATIRRAMLADRESR
jgi:putative ABC transport system substrate-binding protein